MGKRNSKRPTSGDPSRQLRAVRHVLGLGLSGPLVKTALALINYSDKRMSRDVFPSRETLAEKVGVAPCTVTRHTTALERAGFCRVNRSPVYFGSHLDRFTRRQTNRYEIHVPEPARAKAQQTAPVVRPRAAVSSSPAAAQPARPAESGRAPPGDEPAPSRSDDPATPLEHVARLRALVGPADPRAKRAHERAMARSLEPLR